ncbi:dUTP diphosphatase [Rhodococcus sp. G-MC3]|uniref:dUTP diphosphatase n=1 Tax=Rhodococcus sp. G-MC3 TaxID=3046209 RepID=UPI0024BAFEEB|nr:dUTP diphosphatase [Rhodococcus sp. G-MC3]MDJ0391726.1 dUTP diphosphatase [Rhodococcus sp. G-MC3]
MDAVRTTDAAAVGAAGPPAVRVTRLDPDLPLPTRAHEGDAGVDLHITADASIAPGERIVVGTGIAVALPMGTVGLVHPRSGLAARSGLSIVNSPGTIDAGYRGEIKVCLINLDPRETIELVRGDRIAQLLVQRVELVTFVEVNALDDTSRGSGGYGSSGGHASLTSAPTHTH